MPIKFVVVSFVPLIASIAMVSGFRPVPEGPGAQETRLILEQFDQDDSGWLNLEERKAAREFLKQNPAQNGGRGPGGPGGRGRGPGGPGAFGGPGGPGGRGGGPGGGNFPEASEGPRVEKSSVTPETSDDLYDPSVLRTLFIDFENSDWESELEDFHGTDVDVPATITVDGQELTGCGIRFRGASSYGHVPSGSKRSLNVSVDMVDEDQRLLGYKTLNLLNAHGDDSMMSTVLYAHVARQYIPAPKANFVRVVINGENWGIYSNVQQYNKQFLKENFDTGKGARWKVHGSPRGGGGLEYLGDDPESYAHPYELKSGGKKSVEKLIELCRVLDKTPVDELPEALEPICNVDGLLWFLALDVGLQNSDGYWVRASDYSIYLDPEDRFHFIPHDMNEAFRGTRGGGGPGGGGPGRGPGGPGGGPGGGRGEFGPPPFGGFGFGPEDRFGPGGPGQGRRELGGPGRGGPGQGGPGQGGPGQGEGPERGRGRRIGGPDDRGPGPGGQQGGDLRGGNRRGGDERGGRGRGGRGPGGGGPGGGGPGADAGATELDPLVALEDPTKPLRSKVLAVPKYREQYLANLKELAEKSLDWKVLGPVVAAHRELIYDEMKIETRGIVSFEAFDEVTAAKAEDSKPEAGGRARMTLKDFAQQRQQFLLEGKSDNKRPQSESRRPQSDDE